ncbi:MAG: FeoB-associated Cys-rich membrane protein [Coriobacteriales bacterium]|nr:FeoB-associated Cys-rich membrane protein [Coriobacteriales bacterium]MDO5708778.1 FeoB-associated Cys-rich membrane protein [Coriobacteriales bacterium]
MNLMDVLIIAVVALAVGFAIRSMIRRQQSGGCGCGCDGCASRAGCPKR